MTAAAAYKGVALGGAMGYWNRLRIERIVADRGIEYLAHFTQFENVLSILDHGLLSRAELGRRGIEFSWSDSARWDNQPEAVSMSISAFYYEMLQQKRRLLPQARWIVLFFDASVLWTHEVRFCRQNAASSSITKAWGNLGLSKYLEGMFDRPPPRPVPAGNQDQDVPDDLTTYPDAEVQVFSPVAPRLLRAAWVEREDWAEILREELERRWPGGGHHVHAAPLSPRLIIGRQCWG